MIGQSEVNVGAASLQIARKDKRNRLKGTQKDGRWKIKGKAVYTIKRRMHE